MADARPDEHRSDGSDVKMSDVGSIQRLSFGNISCQLIRMSGYKWRDTGETRELFS